MIFSNIRFKVPNRFGQGLFGRFLQKLFVFSKKRTKCEQNEHFDMTCRQDCGRFASFSIDFPPKNAQEEFYGKK